MFDKVIANISAKYPGIDEESLQSGFEAVLSYVKNGEVFEITASDKAETPDYNLAADNFILAYDMWHDGKKEAALSQIVAAFEAEDAGELREALNVLNSDADNEKITAALHKGIDEDEDEDDEEHDPFMGDATEDINFEDENSDPAAIHSNLTEIVSSIVSRSIEENKKRSGLVESSEEEGADPNGENEEDESGGIDLEAALTDPVFGLPTSDTAVDESITGDKNTTEVNPIQTEGDPAYTHVQETPETLDQLTQMMPSNVSNDVTAAANRIIRKGGASKESIAAAYKHIMDSLV